MLGMSAVDYKENKKYASRISDLDIRQSLFETSACVIIALVVIVTVIKII